MFFRLLILFITIPILELSLFLRLGSRIGIPATVAIVILTAILGAWLTKIQGLKTMARYQRAIQSGKIPHGELIDGLLILIAGALLLTPGFLTDTVGFLLLVPPVRKKVRGMLGAYLKRQIQGVEESMDAPAPKKAEPVITIEAEVIEDRVIHKDGTS